MIGRRGSGSARSKEREGGVERERGTLLVRVGLTASLNVSRSTSDTGTGRSAYSHLSKVLVKHFSAGAATTFLITKIAVTQQQLLCNKE